MENEIVVVEWTIDDVMGELKRISLVSEPAIKQILCYSTIKNFFSNQ
jgi:hypothetical protein